MFRTSIHQAFVAALTLCCASAQAGYVLSSQGVNFEFNQLDADSFTLKITNANAATGNWSTDTHLGFLAFKDLGALAGLTSANVTNISPVSSSTWAYSANELNGNGCLGGNSGGICLDANPDIPLTGSMLFQIDLVGAVLAIDPAVGPHLKLGFTYWADAKGDPGAKNYQPAHYEIGGDLLSLNMKLATGCTGPTCSGGGDGAGGATTPLPEPASLGLAGLALLMASQARRQRRSGP